MTKFRILATLIMLGALGISLWSYFSGTTTIGGSCVGVNPIVGGKGGIVCSGGIPVWVAAVAMFILGAAVYFVGSRSKQRGLTVG